MHGCFNLHGFLLLPSSLLFLVPFLFLPWFRGNFILDDLFLVSLHWIVELDLLILLV